MTNEAPRINPGNQTPDVVVGAPKTPDGWDSAPRSTLGLAEGLRVLPNHNALPLGHVAMNGDFPETPDHGF